MRCCSTIGTGALAGTLTCLLGLSTPAAGDFGREIAKQLADDGGTEDSFGRAAAISGSTAIIGALDDDVRGRDSGSAYLFDVATGEQIAKLVASDGQPNDQFSFSVGLDGNVAIVGANGADTSGVDSGAAYLFDADTGEQLSRLVPSDGLAGDRFGSAVAISGGLVVVGASQDDTNGGSSGSAYVFDVSDPRQPVELAKFFASDAGPSSFFGGSVAMSGTIAVIGASEVGAARGAAYLFDLTDANNPAEIARLQPGDIADFERFGESVAIDGELAVIGAKFDADNGFRSGSAYVYDVTTQQLVSKLVADDGGIEDMLGNSVAIQGDLVVAGAVGSDSVAANSGAACVFDARTGEQLDKLTADDGAAADLFGFAVALDGSTAVIGAYLDDDRGEDSGSAYVFDASTGEQERKLVPRDSSVGDLLGSAVATDGEITLVGAPRDSDSQNDGGSAYLFDARGRAPLAKLVADDGAAGDLFGVSVAMGGDLGAIGASGDDGGAGSAYLFDLVAREQILKLTAGDGALDDAFGASVGVSAGLALVGAPGDDDNGGESGSAYVFDGATGQQLHKLLADDGQGGDGFGASVSLHAGLAVVGAPGDDDLGQDAGAVYVFDATSGALLRKFTADDGGPLDEFGSGVSVRDATLVAGAPGDAGGGSAYLFDLNGGRQIAKLEADSRGKGDRTGAAVGLSATTVVVGAPMSDGGGLDGGAAYLFDSGSGEQLATLRARDASPGARMGASVAIGGVIATVGAPMDDERGNDAGAAIAFDADRCGADLDGDGAVDSDDFFLYLDAFVSNNRDTCDIDGDGDCDGDDYFGFLDLFEDPC